MSETEQLQLSKKLRACILLNILKYRNFKI